MADRRRLSPRERQTVYRKTNGRCAYCGGYIKFKEMQVDHVMPLRKGGADTLENMLPACRSCNHYKGSLTMAQFRKSVERMPEVLMRDNVTYKNAVRFGLVWPMPRPVTFYFEKLGTRQKE
ncbi:MAG: HNH endonuclease [Dysosmobacter sp.]|nr:HNH endonuclease [Dysosmobacter sp.]